MRSSIAYALAAVVGRVFLHETLPKSVLVAGALIIAAVILITRRNGVRRSRFGKDLDSPAQRS